MKTSLWKGLIALLLAAALIGNGSLYTLAQTLEEQRNEQIQAQEPEKKAREVFEYPEPVMGEPEGEPEGVPEDTETVEIPDPSPTLPPENTTEEEQSSEQGGTADEEEPKDKEPAADEADTAQTEEKIPKPRTGPEREGDILDSYREMYGEPIEVTGNTAVYKTGEHTYKSVMLLSPLTYKAENGAEEPIDNTLVSEENGFTNAANRIDVTFPEEVNRERGIRLTDGDLTVELKPTEGDYREPVVDKNAIRYNQVFPDVDIQYTVNGLGYKEDIILNTPSAKKTYTYTFSKDGLTAAQKENIIEIFREGEDTPRFSLSAPLMVDAAGNQSRDIQLELTDTDEEYRVTLSPNNEWLTDTSRAYPVKVDPTITGYTDISVAYTVGTQANWVTESEAYVGYTAGLGKTRTIIYFESPPTDAAFFHGKYITSANLFLTPTQANPGNTVRCYRLEDKPPTWDENPTWEKIVALTRKNAGEKSSFTPSTDTQKIDVRDSINANLHGLAPFYGFELIADNEDDFAVEFTTWKAGVDSRKQIYMEFEYEDIGDVDQTYKLDDTTINLRPIVKSTMSGTIDFQGVFADGITMPGASVKYELNDASKGYKDASEAVTWKIFPDSSYFDSYFSGTKYKDNVSNWQTIVPFTNPDYNKIYQINASAAYQSFVGKQVASDKFLLYKVAQFDTLKKIADYYGVTTDQLAYDNTVVDPLLAANNELFIRNPKKNEKNPYTPPELEDSDKARIDSLLMGRGLHCEFGFEPINLNTGNFYVNQQDVTLPGYDGEFILERNYNSKGAAFKGLFGHGWQTGYEERLSKNADGSFYYRREDGSIMYIEYKGGETYQAPEGYDLTFRRVRTGFKTVDLRDGNGPRQMPLYEYEITDSNQRVRRFNQEGYLSRITDAQGKITSVAYDTVGNLSSVTSPAGYQFQYQCNTKGLVERVTVSGVGTWQYGYDNQDNLTSVTSPEGITLTYVYDGAHRMVEWYDGNHVRVVKNTYDDQGRVTSQTDANGGVSRLAYQNGSTVTTDAAGNTTAYYYDSGYRTTRIVYPDGSTVNRAYSGNRMISETDPLNHTTRYTYDNRGNILTVTRYDGAVRRYEYNAANKVTRFTDYDNVATTYSYDSRSNLIKEETSGRSVSYGYNGNNQLIAVTDAAGRTITYTYNGAILTSVTDPQGSTTAYTRNSRGDVTAVTDALGGVSRYTYNRDGWKLTETNADGAVTRYTYDKAGNVTSITDGRGNTTAFTYDGVGNILTAQDPLGHTLSYTYDALGNLLSKTDANGQTIRYAYDAMSRKVSVTNAENGITRYRYDALGNLIEETDASGYSTVYTYDYRNGSMASSTNPKGEQAAAEYDIVGNLVKERQADGKETSYEYNGLREVIRQSDPNGLVTEYAYDMAGNLTRAEDNVGRVYTYAYDKNGRMTRINLPNQASLAYEYDALGQLLRSTDALGNETVYTYSRTGRLLTATDPLGGVTRYSYDENGNQTASTDPNGNTTAIRYNALDQVETITDPDGYQSHYSYDAGGRLTSTADPLGGVVRYVYDGRGLPTAVTDAGGETYGLTYDANGYQTKLTAPDGTWMTYQYDETGLLVKSEDSEGLITEYSYDSMGRMVERTDNAGNKMSCTYDEAGRLLSETDSLGRITRYTYDLAGNLTSQTTPDGNTIVYGYDKMGNVISITDARGETSHYEYDAGGRLLSVEDEKLRKYHFTYDALGRLTGDTNPLGEETSYAYDRNGNLTSRTDPLGNAERYTYDNRDNPLTVTDKNGNTTAYTYDALNRIIHAEYADGGVEDYLYDARGNLIKYQDPEGNVTEYGYDPVSRVTSITTPKGGTWKYTYNGRGTVVTTIDPMGSVTEAEDDLNGRITGRKLPNGAQYGYTYDAAGRITGITGPEGQSRSYTYSEEGDLIQEQDQAGRSISYEYDQMHQLIKTTNPEGAQTSYEYDVMGNMISTVSPMGAKTTYTYDALDRIQSLTDPTGLITELSYDPAGNLKELRERGGSLRGVSQQAEGRATSLSYDAVGNLLSVTNPLGQTRKYTYDVMNRMTEETDTAGHITSYQYNHNGQVTEILEADQSKVRLSYDKDGNLASLTDGEGRTASYTYDLLDRLTMVTDASGVSTSYTYDTVGNLTGITDGNGNTTTYDYDLAGRLIRKTNALEETQEYTYDQNQNLSELHQADGSVITYDYDKLDRLLSVDYGKEEEPEVLYGYDGEGRRISMKDLTGICTYEYNKAGQLTAVTGSDGKRIGYAYDIYGNLAELTYPDGKTVTYTYDKLDRLTSITDREGKVTTYTYDLAGNLIHIIRPNDTETQMEYNEIGNMTLLTNRSGKEILSQYAYEYDLSGSILKETITREDETETTYYGYTPRGELAQSVSVRDGKETLTRYAYDAAGNRIRIEKSEAQARKHLTEYVYNEANRMVLSKDSLLGTRTYEYDANGNLVRELAPDEEITEYHYDAENRLSAVAKGGSLLMAALYDGDGNRLFTIEEERQPGQSAEIPETESPDVVTSHFIYRLWDRFKELTYGNQKEVETRRSEWDETVYEGETTNFFWYGFGQGVIHTTTSVPMDLSRWFHNAWTWIQETTQHYRHIRHIRDKEIETVTQEPEVSTRTEYSQQDETTLPYEKNAEGGDYEQVLYEKVLIPAGEETTDLTGYVKTSYVNDVNRAYTQVLMEYGPGDELHGVYDYGVNRNSLTDFTGGEEQTQYYTYDGRGSVVGIHDETGREIAGYRYDAFGETEISGTSRNPYQYNAEYTDRSTGLQYLRARYYNPVTANFMTQDTYGGELLDPITQNLYAYTGNDPVNMVDPSGHAKKKNNYSIKDLMLTSTKIVTNIAKSISNPKKSSISKTVVSVVNIATTGINSIGVSRITHRSTNSSNQKPRQEVQNPKTIAETARAIGKVIEIVKNTKAAYIDGVLYTAMTEAEQKLCKIAERIETKHFSQTVSLNRVQNVSIEANRTQTINKELEILEIQAYWWNEEYFRGYWWKDDAKLAEATAMLSKEMDLRGGISLNQLSREGDYNKVLVVQAYLGTYMTGSVTEETFKTYENRVGKNGTTNSIADQKIDGKTLKDLSVKYPMTELDKQLYSGAGEVLTGMMMLAEYKAISMSSADFYSKVTYDDAGNVIGAGGRGAGETELFLPDEFYEKNLPSQVSPGMKYLPKYDEFGNVKQIKIYDDYGREIGWVDYTNHGYGNINSPDYHTVPHWHERIYDAQNRDGMKTNYRTDTNTPLGDK